MLYHVKKITFIRVTNKVLPMKLIERYPFYEYVAETMLLM